MHDQEFCEVENLKKMEALLLLEGLLSLMMEEEDGLDSAIWDFRWNGMNTRTGTEVRGFV